MAITKIICSAFLAGVWLASTASGVSITSQQNSSLPVQLASVSPDATTQAQKAFLASDISQPTNRTINQPVTSETQKLDPGISPINLDVYLPGSKPKDRQQEVMESIIIGLSCADDVNAIKSDGLGYHEIPQTLETQKADATSPFIFVSMLVCLLSVAYFIFKNKFLPRRGFDY